MSRPRGANVLDVLVVLALLTLLVYLVRMDWRPAPAPPTSTTTAAP